MDQVEFRGYAARFRRSCRCIWRKRSGQLPQRSCARQEPFAEGQRPSPKTSVEDLAAGTGPQARRPERTDHPPRQARQELFIPFAPTARRSVTPAPSRRLHSMAVPPAYRDVRYSPDPTSHLQAVGLDAAGRLQYRYHADWEKVREHRKAHRLARLVAALPKIRRNVSAHLSGDEPTREFALSAVIELIARTAIRPGNESYARLNGTRGATTLLKSNVTLEDDSLVLTFKAKGGKAVRKECDAAKLGARHRHPAHRAGQAHVPVPRQFRQRCARSRPRR